MTAQAAVRSSPSRCLLRLVRSLRSTHVEPTPAGAQPPLNSWLLSALAHGFCIFFSRLFLPGPRVRPSRCLCALLPPPSARYALLLAAVAAGLERWPERRKRRKRGVRPGPCRSPRPGPATAPAPPPSQERTRPAWTGMGVRAAPSCAAAPAAAGAEQYRRPGLWPPSPPPPLLLLLLLLSLGLLHAGRRGPGGERAARALFWVRNATALAGEQGTHGRGFTLLPSASGLHRRRPVVGSQRAGAACGTDTPGLYCSRQECLLEPAADRVSATLVARMETGSPVLFLLYSWGWRRGPESHTVQRFSPELGGKFRRNLS